MATLAILISTPQARPILLINGILSLFLMGVLLMAHKSYDRLASVLFILLFEIYSAYALYHFGGNNNPVSSTLLVIIMVAAMLLGQLVFCWPSLPQVGSYSGWRWWKYKAGSSPQRTRPAAPNLGRIFFNRARGRSVVMYTRYNSIHTVM